MTYAHIHLLRTHSYLYVPIRTLQGGTDRYVRTTPCVYSRYVHFHPTLVSIWPTCIFICYVCIPIYTYLFGHYRGMWSACTKCAVRMSTHAMYTFILRSYQYDLRAYSYSMYVFLSIRTYSDTPEGIWSACTKCAVRMSTHAMYTFILRSYQYDLRAYSSATYAFLSIRTYSDTTGDVIGMYEMRSSCTYVTYATFKFNTYIIAYVLQRALRTLCILQTDNVHCNTYRNTHGTTYRATTCRLCAFIHTGYVHANTLHRAT